MRPVLMDQQARIIPPVIGITPDVVAPIDE
jgi:hypothetical protein